MSNDEMGFQRARNEMLAVHAMADIACRRAETCQACKHHNDTHRVPCLEHTPLWMRAARARALGLTR